MKSRFGQVSLRTLVAILVAIILSVLIYIVLEAIGMGQGNAISVGGLVLIGSIAWLVTKSTEKKLGILFICIGFSLRPIVSFLLLQFGINQSIASTISILIATAVIVAGLAISGTIAKKLRPN